MGTMLDNVTLKYCQRPAYTSYELSKRVMEKKNELGLDIEEFSGKFNIQPKVVQWILESKRSFNHLMYKACSVILGISIEELLRIDSENMECVSFRALDISEKTIAAVELANQIFDEIIMQHKIGAR
ncbi:hypothetical protein [Pelosinus sp. IPA-1]|uniref:hypothetical protein n=1 Tax=Pelosinus sp. IPA-1 TaxID=3029569 RepID=UPI0024362AE3|nr:hypothetical protein [Pelosinus sp. IPA-1]GMB00096.1 hypothetical protein PIPA1_28950 [Pelosinus sp. IPA-1]